MTTKTEFPILPWPDLIAGVLVRRYKRFIADVKLENGEIVAAHCPNSGKMTGCAEPGRPVYLSHHDIAARKLKYTWQLIHMPDSLVGVNTQVPNRLVKATVSTGVVSELSGYSQIKSEAVTGDSRIDLLLTQKGRRPCYVEIKNCTLVENRAAMFPDAVTQRGLKHLNTLGRLMENGARCVMFYLIQRMDAGFFGPADHVDPAYGRGLRQAAAEGVEILVFDVDISLSGICLRNRLPVRL